MRFKIVLFSLLFISILAAQVDLETIISQDEETSYPTELMEFLQNIRKKPVNINTIIEEDLYLFPWLTEIDVKKILEYRKSHKINKISDLRKLNISNKTINEIKNYITFKTVSRYKIQQISRAEFHQQKQNYPSTLKYFQKTILDLKKLKIGFISQKDEGEKDPLDFYSYFIEYTTDNFLKKCLIGKYRLALGQGILFASKLGTSKSGAATSTPIKKFHPIKPYTSSYEIWEMEGAAANLRFSYFNLIPFFSKTSLSTNLDTLDQITSFNESGIHHDENKKNNVKEMIYGLAAKLKWRDHSFGLNFANLNFDHEFSNSAQKSEYAAISIDFILNRSSYPAFGEFACTQDKIAGVLGGKFGENKLRHLLLFRYFEKDFPTWHGNPFSSQSRFDNEVGLYYGMTIIPLERVKINCYFDLWSFPGTRYFEKMPTVGSEQYIQVERKFKVNSLRLTVQHKNKEKYISLDQAKIRDFARTTFKIDWWQIITNLRFKTRCELVTEYLPEDKIHESGILAYEEIRWKIEKFTMIGQVTVYHSDVLHYMYEHNVDGIMQNSVLNGDGIYSYFVFKYNLFKSMELQFKFSDHWNTKDKLQMYLQVVSNF